MRRSNILSLRQIVPQLACYFYLVHFLQPLLPLGLQDIPPRPPAILLYDTLSMSLDVSSCIFLAPFNQIISVLEREMRLKSKDGGRGPCWFL